MAACVTDVPGPKITEPITATGNRTTYPSALIHFTLLSSISRRPCSQYTYGYLSFI